MTVKTRVRSKPLRRGETASEPLWGVVILAAGASVRMGRPKMLLPWRRTSVLGSVIALGRQFPDAQIAVVVPAHDERLRTELRRLRLPLKQRIENPEPARGMFSSLQCAARWPGWQPQLTHWAILLGDQPQLQPATLRALAQFAAGRPRKICQPARGHRPRHPVVLPAAVFRELAAAADESLRHFLRSRATKVRLIEIDDPGLDLDFDTPADYERVIAS